MKLCTYKKGGGKLGVSINETPTDALTGCRNKINKSRWIILGKYYICTAPPGTNSCINVIDCDEAENNQPVSRSRSFQLLHMVIYAANQPHPPTHHTTTLIAAISLPFIRMTQRATPELPRYVKHMARVKTSTTGTK